MKIIAVLQLLLMLMLGLPAAIYHTITIYEKLKTKKQEKLKTNLQMLQSSLALIIAIFCLSSLSTLLTQYLYPPYAVWADRGYKPLMRIAPIGIQVVILALLAISSGLALRTFYYNLKER